MAHKDFRAASFLYLSVTPSNEDPTLARAEQIMAELAQEMGFSDSDSHMSGGKPDEGTLVYDKFLAGGR